MSAWPNVEGNRGGAGEGIKYYAAWDSGYSKQQSTRPQTLQVRFGWSILNLSKRLLASRQQ